METSNSRSTTTAEAEVFFSIILPLYNREKFIAAAIQSVQSQTFDSWELIVVDDGSTDNSVGIVNDYCRLDSRIKLIQQENKKQPAARNTGIKTARGQWIAFIDSDDLWLPRKLELQFERIMKDDQIDVVFSDGYTKFHDSPIRVYYHYDIVHGFFHGHDLYKKMLFGNLIPILSLAIKRSWIARVGEQDEAVAGVEDHDYCLRLCREGANFYGMTDRLIEYHVHDSNFSGDMVNQHYMSSGIRIKNYHPELLDRHDIKRFKLLFLWYLNYFRSHGKPEWAIETRKKLKQLNIPPLSSTERAKKFARERLYIVWMGSKRRAKGFFYLTLKFLYFYPKRSFSGFKDRVFTRYVKWLNSTRISSAACLRLSSNANITFSDRDGAPINVKSLIVGEYSRINLLTKESTLIGGADIVIKNYCNFDVRGQLLICNNVVFDNGSMLSCYDEIDIGDDCYFGEGSKLYDYHYDSEAPNIPFARQNYRTRKIKIGNNVRIGSNVVILPGTEIGDGCIIGANNVICGSLPSNSFVESFRMNSSVLNPDLNIGF